MPGSRLLCLLLLVLLLAGCFGPGPGPAPDWQQQADAHGAMGLEAAFDLGAVPFYVTGKGTVQPFGAPFWIVPSVPGWEGTPPYVFLETTLPDEGPGVLRVEGSQVRVTTGTVTGLGVERVEGQAGSLRLSLLADDDHAMPAIAWSDAQVNVSSDLFHARPTPLKAVGLRLDSFQRAVFYRMDGTSKDLGSPLVVDARAVALLPESLIVFQAAHLNITYGAFGWAGAASEGTLTTQTGVGLPRPSAVFGRDATLEVAAGRAKSTAPFRLTQAVGPNGPLVPAEVEVRVRDDTVSVVEGGTAWAAVEYREKGYAGAAVARTVRVTGSGAEDVEVPLGRPPGFVATLWEKVPVADPWARSFGAVFALLGAPGAAWADAGAGPPCQGAPCPEEHPYPIWMEPGETGTFYVKLGGGARPGVYTADVVIEGADHEPVSFTVRFEVVAPSATPG